MYLTNGISTLSQYIEKDPGVIVGPITNVLGWIINVTYNLISSVSSAHALGISIIVLTIITRTIILPFGFKQQKSTMAMQKIQPEVNKIKAKYGDTKDPELLRKMNAEVQALQSKNGVNMLAGCLPMFITLPIFFGLNYVMRQTYMFVNKIGDIYHGLAATLFTLPDAQFDTIVRPVAETKLQNPESALTIELFQKILNKFTAADWNSVLSQLSGPIKDNLQVIYDKKLMVESFLGLDLISASGMAWPGILIPILTALTTFLSSYIMNKTSGQNADPSAQKTQKYMLIVMPIMMGWFTISMSSGVGIYWITSSVYQIAQQYLLYKYYSRDSKKEAVK